MGRMISLIKWNKRASITYQARFWLRSTPQQNAVPTNTAHPPPSLPHRPRLRQRRVNIVLHRPQLQHRFYPARHNLGIRDEVEDTVETHDEERASLSHRRRQEMGSRVLGSVPLYRSGAGTEERSCVAIYLHPTLLTFCFLSGTTSIDPTTSMRSLTNSNFGSFSCSPRCCRRQEMSRRRLFSIFFRGLFKAKS